VTKKMATYTILGQVHVGGKDVGSSTVHLFAQKVLLQRSVTHRVVLQRNVSVCAESTGKHGNVSEDAFQRFVEDVGHLVLKVLSGDERFEKFDTKGACEAS
jgi:hypothetical protein